MPTSVLFDVPNTPGGCRDVSKYKYGCSEWAGMYCQKLIRRITPFASVYSTNRPFCSSKKPSLALGPKRLTSNGKVGAEVVTGSSVRFFGSLNFVITYDGPPSPE